MRYNFKLNQIAKMDETPFFVNIQNTKTIGKVGSKDVDIKPMGKKKIHVKATQWIVADGTKIPNISFNDQLDNRVEKRLHKNSLINYKKVFAYYQPKKWNNMTIIKKWINEVWRRYTHFVLKKDMMLVMDDTSLHTIDNVKDKIKECKAKISMIPGGIIRYLQPLDVSINKPFKDDE